MHPDATLDNLPNDWVLVEETTKPEYQEGKAVVQTEPQEINGVWKQQWIFKDLTVEEKAGIDKHNAKVQEFLAKLEAVQNESSAL